MTTARPAGVSDREAQVLALLGAHLTNAQIAGRLHLSVRTVEHHVSSLLRKCGVADRRALAEIAARIGPAEPAGPDGPDWAAPGGAGRGRLGPPTSFVGRAHEHDSVRGLLTTARLITLVGPGGVGKTRLAAVVADAAAGYFPFGATFVDLVPVDGDHVVAAVAAAVGVAERPPQPLLHTVTDRLPRGRWLLVLDNCEHLIDDAARFVAALLAACPDTTILATSRERLGVPGEHVVPIAPLPLGSDAETLFADRAGAADPGFAADPAVVAEICARLDGMPLAIELAAARCGALGTGGLLAALDDTVRALTGGRGGDERHGSLRAVLGWSHDLLVADERVLFRRLALFRGSFDLDAAVAITDSGNRATVADLLGRLVDKSLVVRSGGRWLLLNTVRAFALDRLAADDDAAAVRRRYLGWAAGTAGALAGRPPDGRWRAEFDAVADDLRAALALAPPGRVPVAHRLARSLGQLAYARRFLVEAVAYLRDAASRAPTPADAAADLVAQAQARYAVGLAGGSYDLLLAAAERAGAAGRPDLRAIALADAVVTAHRFTSGFAEPVPAERLAGLLAEATGLAEEAGLAEATVPAEATAPAEAADRADRADLVVTAHLAAAAAWHAEPRDPALDRAAVAAARRTGDPVLLSAALDLAGTAAEEAGQPRRARRLARDRLTLLRRADRHHPYAVAEILHAHHVAWLSALGCGDLPGALAVATAIGGDDLLAAHPYRAAGKLIPPLVLMGRFDEALGYAEPMWRAWRRSGTPIAMWLSFACQAVALAYGLRGDEPARRRWRTRAGRAAGGGDRPACHRAFAAFVDARVATHTGALADASALVARTRAARGWPAAYARAAGAELAVVAGLPDADRALSAAAAAAGHNEWAAACCARTAGRLGDRAALADAIRRWDRIEARFDSACTRCLATG